MDVHTVSHRCSFGNTKALSWTQVKLVEKFNPLKVLIESIKRIEKKKCYRLDVELSPLQDI